MTTYWDTSALIKRYLREDGCDEVDRIFNRSPSRVTSAITYAEIYATLARGVRERMLSPGDRELLSRRFEGDWRTVTHLSPDGDVFPEVRALAGTAALKGADLIHLASAAVLARRLELTFVSSDTRLLGAAADRGITTLNPVEAAGRH